MMEYLENLIDPTEHNSWPNYSDKTSRLPSRQLLTSSADLS